MEATNSRGVVRETDIERDAQAPLGPLAGVTLTAQDNAAAQRARAGNPLRHVDHFAFGCRDARATRDFYERILGLPLVNTLVLEDDIISKGAMYCHFFFELGDGHFLAFFDHTTLFAEGDFTPKSGFHQHVAFEVTTDETVQSFRTRLEAAGVKTQYVDHGLYHSLYFTDPNGINLEVTYKPPGTADFEAKSRKIASKLLDDWVARRDHHRTASLAKVARTI